MGCELPEGGVSSKSPVKVLRIAGLSERSYLRPPEAGDWLGTGEGMLAESRWWACARAALGQTPHHHPAGYLCWWKGGNTLAGKAFRVPAAGMRRKPLTVRTIKQSLSVLGASIVPRRFVCLFPSS